MYKFLVTAVAEYPFFLSPRYEVVAFVHGACTKQSLYIAQVRKLRPYTREDRMYGVNMYDRTWQVRYS